MHQQLSKKNTLYTHFKWSFLHPRYWGTWLAVLFAGVLAFIPFQVRDKIAQVIAKQLVKLNNRAKKRAVINLEQCFPEKSKQERLAILEQSYINAACIMLSLACITLRSKNYLEKKIIFHNEDILTSLREQGENVILLVPHCWAVDFPAIVLASRGMNMTVMVKKQANPVADWLMTIQRTKYDGRIHERSDGIKPFIKSVRAGFIGYYLPDEDYGHKHSVFVPFLATQKATLAGLGTVAKLSRSKIVPMMPAYCRKTGKIEVIFQPPLDPFPSASEETDARMMNERIEQFINEKPEQYMWIMNLLRSRPDGSQLY